LALGAKGDKDGKRNEGEENEVQRNIENRTGATEHIPYLISRGGYCTPIE
jgi:hypothetical protein